MINCLLMGTKKHGCQIDNNNFELTYYEYLSLYDKFKKKKQVVILKYSEIEVIRICYGLTTGVRFDSAQITLEITTHNKTVYDVPATYYDTKMDDLKLFITVLQNSGLKIEDPYDILPQALNTDLDLIAFIKQINTKMYSKK